MKEIQSPLNPRVKQDRTTRLRLHRSSLTAVRVRALMAVIGELLRRQHHPRPEPEQPEARMHRARTNMREKEGSNEDHQTREVMEPNHMARLSIREQDTW